MPQVIQDPLVALVVIEETQVVAAVTVAALLVALQVLVEQRVTISRVTATLLG